MISYLPSPVSTTLFLSPSPNLMTFIKINTPTMDNLLPKPPREALFVYTIFLLSLCSIIKAQPNFLFIDCPNATLTTTSTYAQNSTYQTNLNTLLSVLSSNSNASNGFYNFTAGSSTPDIAYGLFICRGDLSAAACQECVVYASTDVVERCPRSKRVTIWYDPCMIRYSNESFFSSPDTGVARILRNTQNVTNATLFREVLGQVMDNIASRASSHDSGKKFATAEANYSPLERVYGLAQCTPDLFDSDCKDCLWYGISTLPGDASRGARVLFPSCYVHYEMSLFYLPPTTPSITGKGGILWRVLVGVIVPIGVIGFCFMCCRTKKKYYFSKPHASKDEITSLQSLQYDLSTVRAATNNFSDDNKIGMGGFGPVYKGTLPNGEEVAVKRLSKNSRQGVEQFKNEVVLIAKIQHVNLVRLLGFCLEGEEKILIYEFLPNKSLDKFLFDSQEQEKLGWPQRYNIIQGIAHGMLYLHEYSSLRIIHRDLKAGNILLDGNMNAKISDFGMARIFDMDQTRAITSRVVGTYGYISPEYAMHGQFSVKSDVFSFGVLLLEVISGKKTNSFYKPDCVENLLSYAWKLWNDGTPLELMDQALEGSYSRNEVHRCIHIGLLCVQHNPDARPSMAKVVGMLNRYSSMSLPQQPAFFAQSRTTSSTLQGLELDRQANTVACE